MVLAKGNPGKLPRGDGILGKWKKEEEGIQGEEPTHFWGTVLDALSGRHTFLPWLREKGQVALHCMLGSLFPSGLGWTLITRPGANRRGLAKQPGLVALCSPAEEVFCSLRTFHQVTALAIICH